MRASSPLAWPPSRLKLRQLTSKIFYPKNFPVSRQASLPVLSSAEFEHIGRSSSSRLRPELKSRFEKYGWQLAASLYFCNRGNSGSYSPSEAAALCKPCTSSKRGTARAAEDQEGLLHLVLFDLGGGSPPSGCLLAKLAFKVMDR